MNLIDKDTLVEEIESYINDTKFSQKAGMIKKRNAETKMTIFKSVLSLIDTLEVKEVECGDRQPMSEAIKIGETEIYLEDDGGEPPYDGKQWLDLSCTEYEIPSDKFKDGDNVEIIIRKAQKGE